MKYFFLSILISIASAISAQSYEGGIWAGGINSWNDINTASSVFDTRPAGGVIGRYNFDSRIGARLSASYGRAFSSDEQFETTDFSTNRNAAARTRTFNISAMGEFNFFDFNTNEGHLDPKIATPFIAAGVSFSNINPEIFTRDDGWVDASSLVTEDDRDFTSTNFSIPLAGGVKYQLNKDFILTGEWSTNILFTDYYDDLSTQFNQTSINTSAGAINTLGRQRGDRFKNDAYNLFGAQLTYVIPIYKCPGE